MKYDAVAVAPVLDWDVAKTLSFDLVQDYFDDAEIALRTLRATNDARELVRHAQQLQAASERVGAMRVAGICFLLTQLAPEATAERAVWLKNLATELSVAGRAWENPLR